MSALPLGSGHCWRSGTMPAAAPIRRPPTAAANRKRSPSTRSSPGIWKPFSSTPERSEHRLPLHVDKEMRAYLECGILAYGLVRARCEDCGASRAVAFFCKKRGFCPSCSGRRMADTAARLVDEVLPRVPASRCSAFPTRCVTASPTTASWSRGYWRYFCVWWAAGIAAKPGQWAMTGLAAWEHRHQATRG